MAISLASFFSNRLAPSVPLRAETWLFFILFLCLFHHEIEFLVQCVSANKQILIFLSTDQSWTYSCSREHNCTNFFPHTKERFCLHKTILWTALFMEKSTSTQAFYPVFIFRHKVTNLKGLVWSSFFFFSGTVCGSSIRLWHIEV